MISVKCEHCKEDLNKPGGLAFSPPDPDDDCAKYHICVNCWPKMEQWLWNRTGKCGIIDTWTGEMDVI